MNKNKILLSSIGIVGVVALMVSFSINPAPPTNLSTAGIASWGVAHQNLIDMGAWLQGVGSFLEIIFFFYLIFLADHSNKLIGWIVSFAAMMIMAVSLVEVGFYLSAVQGGISGDLNLLSTSLNLIKAIQHAYVIAPAPAFLIAIGIMFLKSQILPKIHAYIALALGIVLAILGFMGVFSSLQSVIDGVLAAQEVWIAALAINVMVYKGKSENR
jgi:hypothetical protein